MRVLATFFCAAGCVFVAACGSVGEPLYPALNIPSSVSDLVAVERGDQLSIYFTIPPLTTEGLAVRGIGSVELRVGANPSAGFNVDQWAASAKRIDLPAPAQPGGVRASVPIQEFIGKEVVVAVRVANSRGRMSGWSNLAVVPVEQALTKPADLKAEPAPQGVRLTWNAPEENSFRIFRKTDQEKEPSVLGAEDVPEYVDSSTEYGKTYEYYVQGIHDRTESDVAGPVSVTPLDKFPPSVPTGLTASAGVAAVELAWNRNTESDLKEYRVYRSDENGPFLPIAEGLEGPSYSDRKIESGKHYRYRVAAGDQNGNISEPSEPVEIIAP